MNTQHTPGPWYVADSLFTKGNVILANHPECGAHICTLPEFKVGQEANARLIAAAPELLRLLHNLTELAAFRGGHLDEYGAAIKEARDLIAKAKGV